MTRRARVVIANTKYKTIDNDNSANTDTDGHTYTRLVSDDEHTPIPA